MEKTSKAVEVLIVEDNPGDVRLTQESLKSLDLLCNFHVVDDGLKAISFLRREEPYRAAARPDIILLDLNLPKKDGREVLAEIKEDPDLKGIPVVVLSSSSFHIDIREVYARHANCYVSKPGDFEPYRQVIRSVFEFWLNVASLPQGG